MRYIIAFILLCLIIFSVFAQDMDNNDSKQSFFGLTNEEWLQYKESGMSEKKLKHLLSCGISLSEYFNFPWDTLNITEDEWIKSRRKGYSKEDIDKEHQVTHYENTDVVISFALPGYGHLKRGLTYKGLALSSVALGSLGSYIFIYKKVRDPSTQKITDIKRYNTFIGILLIDCVISAADVWRITRYDDNPDMKYFSLDINKDSYNLSYSYSF